MFGVDTSIYARCIQRRHGAHPFSIHLNPHMCITINNREKKQFVIQSVSSKRTTTILFRANLLVIKLKSIFQSKRDDDEHQQQQQHQQHWPNARILKIILFSGWQCARQKMVLVCFAIADCLYIWKWSSRYTMFF